MFDLLREYASRYHHINLPGIGTIGLEKSPARADFSDKMFYPPKDEWKLLNIDNSNDESLPHFISRKKNISISAAKEELDFFCRDINNTLVNPGEIKLPGIGILKNDSNGYLQL